MNSKKNKYLLILFVTAQISEIKHLNFGIIRIFIFYNMLYQNFNRVFLCKIEYLKLLTYQFYFSIQSKRHSITCNILYDTLIIYLQVKLIYFTCVNEIIIQVKMSDNIPCLWGQKW